MPRRGEGDRDLEGSDSDPEEAPEEGPDGELDLLRRRRLLFDRQCVAKAIGEEEVGWRCEGGYTSDARGMCVHQPCKQANQL